MLSKFISLTTLGRKAWLLISRDKLESDFSTTINNVCFSKLLIEIKSPLNKGRDKALASWKKNRSSLHSNGWTALPHLPTKQFTLNTWTKVHEVHSIFTTKMLTVHSWEGGVGKLSVCFHVDRWNETLTSDHTQKSTQTRLKTWTLDCRL